MLINVDSALALDLVLEQAAGRKDKYFAAGKTTSFFFRSLARRPGVDIL
jgi:hypothetical protein